jgi:shikimate dehydrogenase
MMTSAHRQQSASRYVGLFGWPVDHSLSPVMHNAAFGALGLPWEYLLLPTPPSGLEQAVRKLKDSVWAGANVTIPYKESIIPHLDGLSPEAGAIGAVNTIVVQDGRCIGHNTDAMGFLRVLGSRSFAPRGKRVLILGAGGAARAVVYSLVQAGAEVVICNRTPERAEALAASFASGTGASLCIARPLSCSVLSEEIARCQLLVNTTSAGMVPRDGLSPWPEDVVMPSGIVVFDLVYAPVETRLLQQARASGASVIDGLQMLVSQGGEAFRLWTGTSPSREVMYDAVAAALRRDQHGEERCCAS